MILSTMALRVAEVVTTVLRGQATAADGTTIQDTTRLTQNNQYWHKGTTWILSGSHLGKVFPVSGFSNNTLTLNTSPLTPELSDDVLYAVSRSIIPWDILASCIGNALTECIIIEDDANLTGNGSTIDFTFPAGVEQVSYIEVEDPATGERTYKSHWVPAVDGSGIQFDYGHAPASGEIIHLMHKIAHPALFLWDDEINRQVNVEWLRWKSAEYVLYWMVQMYGEAKEYRIEELMNRVMTKLKTLYPVVPRLTIRTGS